MAYAGNDAFDFYFGGGAGYSLFTPILGSDAEKKEYGHSLGDFAPFSSAWYISGITGLRFNVSETFSIGAELNYRYLMPAEKHSASADIVFGFSF